MSELIVMNDRVSRHHRAGRVIGFCADLALVAWDDEEPEWVEIKTLNRERAGGKESNRANPSTEESLR